MAMMMMIAKEIDLVKPTIRREEDSRSQEYISMLRVNLMNTEYIPPYGEGRMIVVGMWNRTVSLIVCLLGLS